uniref:5'-nucleotidase, cytosolic IIIB n=1 Tax=Sander lucioperca TaxID=283035 RepID=A0A8C9ZZG0_SANLU
MVEWWTKAHELLVQQKIRKDLLAMVVQESDAMLRGLQLLFDHLYEHSIPLLIFSAGIGDILEEVIRQAGVFHPNVKVFSNYMDFDESVEERKQSYLDSYDIVLLKDETLEVPNAIMLYLTGNN